MFQYIKCVYSYKYICTTRTVRDFTNFLELRRPPTAAHRVHPLRINQLQNDKTTVANFVMLINELQMKILNKY